MTTDAASEPELLVFNALVRKGQVPGVDFSFQEKRFGGRIDKGGIVIDFFFPFRNLAINVQGIYFHYEQGTAVMQDDRLNRELLASQGIKLIFIDEDDILTDVDFYVDNALAERDLSRVMGRV